MTAVIYARYSSDNQREAPLKGSCATARTTPRRTVSPWSAPTLTVPILPRRMTARTSSE